MYIYISHLNHLIFFFKRFLVLFLFYICEKKIIKKLFDEIRMLQINFIMMCITHKISALLKITRILKTLFKECNRLLSFKKKN